MESSLLLSLFITHLAVGGELLQYSTDIIYVSKGGTDNSSCLNGESHCKTLGYVLTNIPMLQCTNCTVMVTYDHVVGPLSYNQSYIADVSNVETLCIIGLEQPNLDFNGSGLKLVNTDNNTLIIIENVKVNNYNDVDLATLMYNYYLLQFTMVNVMVHNSTMRVVTRNLYYCHSLYSKSNIFLSVAPGEIGNKIVVLNSTLQLSFLFIYVLDSVSINTILIRKCHFSYMYSIALRATCSNCSIDFIMTECQLDACLGNQSSVYHCIQLSFGTWSMGSFSITNNHFINGRSNGSIINVKMYPDNDSGPLNQCNITVNCYNNTFFNNKAIDILYLEYLNNILYIGNTTFKNNVVNATVVYFQYDINEFQENGILVHNSAFLSNRIQIKCRGAIVTAIGSGAFVLNYYNNTFFDNIATEILCFNELIIHIGNTTFINNVVNKHIVYLEHGAGILVLHDLTFLNNSVIPLPTADEGAIVRIGLNNGAHVGHINFTNNTGTPLSIMGSSTSVTITGDIVFSNNNAITGGGMYVSHGCYVTIADNATVNVTFINNVASYGGAIYADTQHCFFNFHHKNSLAFNGNHANIGSSIFSSYDWCSINCAPVQSMHNYIASLPTNVSFNISNTTSVFPGQTIVGDMTVIDCLGSASSCLADVSLRCNGRICGIQGLSTVFLSNGTINTGLKITINSEYALFRQVQLKFTCKSPIRQLPLVLTVEITVLSCPLGFAFNSSTGQCECINNGKYFICNKDIGLVCVKKGYWYSNYSGTASKCIHLFCDYSKWRKVCPSTVSPDSTDYLLLDRFLDNQCIDGHGGTLCTGCALNKLPTYGALQCIDSNKCTRWHPYILMLLNIAIPFIDGVFLMIVIRLKLNIGSGYLYGPLFYLAVLNLVPTSYSTLNTIISSFVATLLLQLKFLGYIPWCFFPSVSLLTSKWFELIGPLVVAIVLLLTVYLARCSPKLLEHFQKSPLQAMCVLVLVLFWSLASTSISVITPVYLSGVKGARVHLQPDVAYLRGDHIPLWIISVIILLILYSIVFVLTFSRFLNLHRLKPILDEFQSCYKDSYRWYGGVYFIMWTILQVLVISSNYELFQTVIIVLTVTHCLLQPYCKKWLNVMDGLFLGSLLSISSCLLSSSGTTVTRVLVYLSVMVPLCVISLGIMSIVMVRFGIMSNSVKVIHIISTITKKASHTQTAPAPQPSERNVTRSVLNIEGSASNYREPLLYYIQDSASHYSATDN